jgi:hypothetical protein
LRADTYVIDLRHYLDETGDLADMPGPALNLAMVFAPIVAWATAHATDDDLPTTNVWCWRRPGRRRCRGELLAELRRDSAEIFWQCPMCGVNGVIRGWKHSLWDRRSGATDATVPST